ncbi:phospholipid transfer protein C2CD2L isoform X2 [Stegostoma tigrinum]|uniref:phospholipid transfer protein C2CD2L isoform X2 n=1 Tax=Stegostoma tigrinum TaxID=3053191 RepID=UPI00202AD55F|nr:phospholipid transfer protein C2CD2L isoform X2 [Stegostoma tigrinum]
MSVLLSLLGSFSGPALLQHAGWFALLLLFAASIVTVLTWLVQYSVGIWRRGAVRQRPPASLGIWSSLLKLGCSREDSVSGSGLKRLITSLFSFKSFRDNWQRTWIKALNDQACRIGSSLQISFEEGPQLPSTACISQVTCTDQSEQSMVLCCELTVDEIQFPVSVTQQSPAAVSMESYQVTLAPLKAQMEICLEEAEVEGLLVTWSFKKPPALSLSVNSKRQKGGNEGKADISTIQELIEDTIISTSPAMLVNLKAHIASTTVLAEKFRKGLASPSKAALNAGCRLLVRELKANVSRAEGVGSGELCCVLELDSPVQLKRTTSVMPKSLSTNSELKWNDELIFELGARSKEMKVKIMEKLEHSENVLLGQSVIPLDLSRRSPSRCHSFPLTATPEMSNTPTGSVSLELNYLEPTDSKTTQSLVPARTVTPTKKIEMDRTVMPDGTIVTTVTTIQSRPKMDGKIDSPTRSPSKVEVTEKKSIKMEDSSVNVSPSNAGNHLANGLDPVVQTAIRQLTESANKPSKKTPTKRSTLIISGISKAPVDQEEMALSVGYAASMDASLQGEPGLAALPHCSAQDALESPKSTDSQNQRQVVSQDLDEAAVSDISERPSVDDVESETGSTGALETRSLKDHKVGFLRSSTKLLFRRRSKQKEPGFSHSHDDLSNVSDSPASTRKKSGSFSRKLIKRFSFKSKSKSKASANGGTAASGN